jgi:ribosome recycling factor
MEHPEQAFERALQALKTELGQLRAGRSNPAMVESIPVQAYQSTMKLLEVASITAPEARLLVIQPWDRSLIKEIEAALRASELGLEPAVDGEVIRISFPPLTEEKRKELVKVVNEKLEEARIAVRKAREEALKDWKGQEKAGEISEDDYFRKEKQLQQHVDQTNAKIKDLGEAKEKELMTL